ncbi:hypothetical protein JTE90_003851 [Oedothorax gibbosus]|uniref:Uncharacterized protein n=1 Tax=Oedothorax gibbosus TaxID=931172 RepID=A0AAV6UH16_9ARAC|nr:hypothetical protein JTE90_003851 [Oedothorax gibbosus]
MHKTEYTNLANSPLGKTVLFSTDVSNQYLSVRFEKRRVWWPSNIAEGFITPPGGGNSGGAPNPVRVDTAVAALDTWKRGVFRVPENRKKQENTKILWSDLRSWCNSRSCQVSTRTKRGARSI